MTTSTRRTIDRHPGSDQHTGFWARLPAIMQAILAPPTETRLDDNRAGTGWARLSVREQQLPKLLDLRMTYVPRRRALTPALSAVHSRRTCACSSRGCCKACRRTMVNNRLPHLGATDKFYESQVPAARTRTLVGAMNTARAALATPACMTLSRQWWLLCRSACIQQHRNESVLR